MIKVATLVGACIDHHVQHDGRPAKVADLFIGDGVINRTRRDVAAAHQRATQQGHHPRVVPAVAMKQRDDGHEHRMQGHLPTDRCTHGHQVRAAVVTDHALGPPGGARCVVQRDAFPFVLWHLPVIGGVGSSQHILVDRMPSRGRPAVGGVRHFDDLQIGPRLRLGRFGQLDELAVGQHHARATVVKDIGHRIHIQPRVDGVQHRTARRHAEMRFGLGGQVGDQRGNHIARRHAHRSQRRGQSRTPIIIFGIGHAVIAIDHRRAPGKGHARAAQV